MSRGTRLTFPLVAVPNEPLEISIEIWYGGRSLTRLGAMYCTILFYGNCRV